jgi:integrase
MASRKRRLTLKIIEGLQPGDIVWDLDLPGFGVRRQKQCASYILKTRVHGRQRWMTIGRHGAPWTPQLARRQARRLMVGAVDGNDLSPRSTPTADAPITVAAAAARFVDEHGPKLKPNSRKLYQAALNRHIVPKLGRRALCDVGPQDVGGLHLSLSDTPRQANIALTVLSSLMSWTMDQQLIPFAENPCQRIRRFTEKKRARFLSLTELTRLGEVLDEAERAGKHSIYALAAIKLLILTGARLNEILTLEWSQVFPDQKLLSLPVSKTGSKSLRLNPQAVGLLSVLPKQEGNKFVIAGHRCGQHLVNLQDTWRHVRCAADLDDVRLHDLRHSFASFAVNSGASLPLIGSLLGHNSVSTTARYAHIAEEQAQDINDKVGDLVGQAMNLNGKEKNTI